MTQSLDRIRFAEKDVVRFTEDVEEWKSNHDALANDCWMWENVIAKANLWFHQFIKLDESIQEVLFTKPEADPCVQEELRQVLRRWLEFADAALLQAARLEREYGRVDGADGLESNARQARAFLTPDHEYFAGEKLGHAEERAIEAYRSGNTEPLLDDERGHS
jgi:hypothetical protein